MPVELTSAIERLNERFPFAVFTHTKHRIMVHFYSDAFSQYYRAQGFDTADSRSQILFPQQAGRQDATDFINRQGELVDEISADTKSFIVAVKASKFAAFVLRMAGHYLGLDDVSQSVFRAAEQDGQATLEVHDEFCTLWREER